LAPYLGNHIITARSSGPNGLAAWQPGELAADDDERRVWQFIKSHGNHPVHCAGYGREDRFANSHRMMAAALSPAAVESCPAP